MFDDLLRPDDRRRRDDALIAALVAFRPEIHPSLRDIVGERRRRREEAASCA